MTAQGEVDVLIFSSRLRMPKATGQALPVQRQQSDVNLTPPGQMASCSIHSDKPSTSGMINLTVVDRSVP